MKPFNLEKFLNGEPAITRDGRKVIDWKYFKNAENGYKLAVIIDKKKAPFFYSDRGNYYKSAISCDYDLFMEEKEVELWVNVYKNNNGAYDAYAYDEEKITNSNRAECNSSFRGTHKITIKE